MSVTLYIYIYLYIASQIWSLRWLKVVMQLDTRSIVNIPPRNVSNNICTLKAVKHIIVIVPPALLKDQPELLQGSFIRHDHRESSKKKAVRHVWKWQLYAHPQAHRCRKKQSARLGQPTVWTAAGPFQRGPPAFWTFEIPMLPTYDVWYY